MKQARGKNGEMEDLPSMEEEGVFIAECITKERLTNGKKEYLVEVSNEERKRKRMHTEFA